MFFFSLSEPVSNSGIADVETPDEVMMHSVKIKRPGSKFLPSASAYGKLHFLFLYEEYEICVLLIF